MPVIKYSSLKKFFFGPSSKPMVLKVYFDLRPLEITRDPFGEPVKSKLFL